MNMKELALRCLIRRDGDRWIAYCLDLWLSAQADSAGDAKAKLHDMIADHLLDVQRAVNNGDRELAHQMLRRKAPLGIRLRYLYAGVIGWSRGGGKEGLSQQYSERGQVPADLG